MISDVDRILFVLTDEAHRRVLLLPLEGRWTLPCHGVVPADRVDLEDTLSLIRLLQRRLPVQAVALYALKAAGLEGAVGLAAFEVRAADASFARDGRWVSREEAAAVALADPAQRSLLEAWFAEQVGVSAVPEEERVMPWIGAGWFDRAVAWMKQQLDRLGLQVLSPIEQVRVFYTGATLRVGTDAGPVYFKAMPRAFIREVAITAKLSAWRPASIPPPLVVDLERRWMLTREVEGITLAESTDVEVWEQVFRCYGQLQRSSLALVEELLDGPLFDWRIGTVLAGVDGLMAHLEWLQEGYAEPLDHAELRSLRARVPALKQLCRQITSFQVPCTLEHTDLHAGNVRLTGGGPVFLDWAWSCVSHPFVGVLGLLRSTQRRDFPPEAVSRMRDAYLGTWTDCETPERLQELFALVQRWVVLLDVLMDAEWVRAYREGLPDGPLLRDTFLEWTLRRRQYYLLRVLRRLAGLAL